MEFPIGFHWRKWSSLGRRTIDNYCLEVFILFGIGVQKFSEVITNCYGIWKIFINVPSKKIEKKNYEVLLGKSIK